MYTYHNDKFDNNVTKFLLEDEEQLNIIKVPLRPYDITKSDKEIISDILKENGINKKFHFTGKFFCRNEINFKNLIKDNYILYQKGDKITRNIYFKNRKIGIYYNTNRHLYVFNWN